MGEERAYWLAWSQISGIGPVFLRRLQQHFGTLSIAWKATKAELSQVEGFGFQTLEKVVKQRSRLHPEQLLIKHQEENPHFWTPADVDYPRLLLETPSPPACLYYRGEVELQENLGNKPLVGIVGTRQPSDYGIRWTRQISTALAKNGFTVVSGMAEGIDTESHAATMKAGGRTIAVLGTGVDIIYPPKNRELYKQILTAGLVVSEYPAKTPPDRNHFPRRNRIIAGLSRAILVIEAPIKSGALITATYANDFGRDVYALPGRIDDYPSQGCLKLISQGASIILKELDELLKTLGAIPQIDVVQDSSAPQQLSLPDLAPELQQVINAIASDALPFDFIIQKTGMDAGSVSSALLQLELMGLVSQLPGMRYQKV
ncbi:MULTISPECIES: DNA-processing protein DprA [unclassified Tolypothrix]|uniref:DNA-processing protein DprA n=1 Tax=unclassified Tolypothrix TaxID=2649714 RepID=UPI0005EAABE1|nr:MULTISPECIES: DNA-processing protein DprA [unclassified Tolypothrix]BAY92409.1 SMF protein [Microchaete diplosiphon NIES-3275]EKF05932.1 DNA processing protein, Smf family [Tolypothrix sp. PCC 7601]MBE9087091.1 DNA-protecting protein DprA [Tolypothrix sp. LEGE 11397]UYD26370.1 DNA-protecting protein DprA [Tolypothrix sp. PCC 7712]UYD31393.1 DNA-protecting protein DprA [Tolypothrix sp. PCC 7601]